MPQVHFLDVRNKGYQRTSLDAYATGQWSNHQSGEPDNESIIREPGLAFGTRVGELMGSEGIELFVDTIS
jgi:hypothetical protein